jgi:hypothetical protein
MDNKKATKRKAVADCVSNMSGRGLSKESNQMKTTAPAEKTLAMKMTSQRKTFKPTK